ncbi:armadillo-type protein [Gorgonomyces haynaldii]|nr:armadillo-type protein [Gorgonomyces haynaldii]
MIGNREFKTDGSRAVRKPRDISLEAESVMEELHKEPGYLMLQPKSQESLYSGDYGKRRGSGDVSIWSSMETLRIDSPILSPHDTRVSPLLPPRLSDNAPSLPEFPEPFWLYEESKTHDTTGVRDQMHLQWPDLFTSRNPLQPTINRSASLATLPTIPPQPRYKSKSLNMSYSSPDLTQYPVQGVSDFLEPAVFAPETFQPNVGVCRYFVQGYCSRGDRCHYAHIQKPQQKPAKKKAEDEVHRYANVPFEDLVSQLYTLCKDQHGCRFLQKKLEERDPSVTTLIFNQVFVYFTDLMIDPFGNYLCQKLLEHISDDQMSMLVGHVHEELLRISLNMHGTRAVQKMIENLRFQSQIDIVVKALSRNVVSLIKDLNGNHVVQKCLNKLSHENNQFIYDAVTAHCVQVATHRHGCCVLQRCIDHASDSQRKQLVSVISIHCLVLVQDAFGNYVVQYVLDLPNPSFGEEIIQRFIGNVCSLSVQKFSSNVIEKCIRVAAPGLRQRLIEELEDAEKLERLLRDSYANYVVQTALDYCSSEQRANLVEIIRPMLPAIRNTPYGKRIQAKLVRDPSKHP